jgi:probable rRNA maturation factor
VSRRSARDALAVEVIGDALDRETVERAAVLAAATAGVRDGHFAVAFVGPGEIAALNAEHRGKEGPTDVLSFPVDGADPDVLGERELGDVVICPEHTVDLAEAVVHGVLHLVGMDHEADEGEMLALQAEVMTWIR